MQSTTTPLLDLSKAKVTRVQPLASSTGSWVKAEKIFYTDPNGTPRDWESCSRTTRVKGSDADGVAILAVVNKNSILLQKQFRPPVNGIVIELPAGLLDPNETIERCAERELLEETGYIGTAVRTSPLIFNDPGFCNTNFKMVTVTIDMNDPRNKSPVPQLEENEFIETFTLPLDSMAQGLKSLSEEGYFIDARVHNIADGLELAKSIHL